MGDPTAAQRAVKAERRRILRGLLDPNPGHGRDRKLAGVMTSPPTITPGVAGAATAISGGVLVAISDPVFRFFGTRAGFGASPDTTNYSPANIASETDTTKTLCEIGQWGFEFGHHGRYLELTVKGTGASTRYRLTVVGDGYDARSGRADTTNNSSTYRILYDFGSVAFRRIRFDLTSQTHVYSVSRGPSDTLFAPTWPKGPRLVVFGDSFTAGANADTSFTAYPSVIGDHLGIHDVVNSGGSGTGYIKVNGTAPKLGDRLQRDLIAAAPDIVLLWAGFNDFSVYAANLIQAAALALATAIKAGLPGVPLIVGTINPNSGSPSAALIQGGHAVRAAVTGIADLIVDPIGGTYPYTGNASNYVNQGWLTGIGHIGAETGSGNADLYVNAGDTIHPSQDGHDHFGRRFAGAIGAWAAAGCPAGSVYSNGVLA